MNEHKHETDNTLDSMLQDWATAQKITLQTLERLQQNVLTAVNAPTPTSPGVKLRVRLPEIFAVCCTIAALVLATGILSINSRRASDQQLARISSRSQREQIEELWSKTSALFGSDLEWLCDLDGELLLGVKGDHATESEKHVYLNLLVRKYDSDTDRWVNTWSGRIVCPLGKPVDFASSDNQSSGSFWVQTLPDGRFVVSNWMKWSELPQISGPIDNQSSPGELQIVADQLIEGQHVQVLQQVWLSNRLI